jgi:hypothetical protein
MSRPCLMKCLMTCCFIIVGAATLGGCFDFSALDTCAGGNCGTDGAATAPPIRLVQLNAPGLGAGSSRTLAFESNVAAGDLIVVFCYAFFLTANQSASISDSSMGTSYEQRTVITPDLTYLGLYYASGVPGGAHTITVNLSERVNRFGVWMFEYDGIVSTESLDNVVFDTASPSGSTMQLATDSLTTSQPNELLLAGFVGEGAGFVMGTNYQQLAVDSIAPAAVEARVVSAPGTYVGVASYTSPAKNPPWADVLAGFRGAM